MKNKDYQKLVGFYNILKPDVLKLGSERSYFWIQGIIFSYRVSNFFNLTTNRSQLIIKGLNY